MPDNTYNINGFAYICAGVLALTSTTAYLLTRMNSCKPNSRQTNRLRVIEYSLSASREELARNLEETIQHLLTVRAETEEIKSSLTLGTTNHTPGSGVPVSADPAELRRAILETEHAAGDLRSDLEELIEQQRQKM